MVKGRIQMFRNFGERDCKNGLPITAFYGLKRKRLYEKDRAAYEFGWRAQREDTRRR